MCIKTFQLQMKRLWKRPLRFGDTILLVQNMQQVEQCRSHRSYFPLAGFFTPACRQVLSHEPSHQELINAAKRKVSSGQPVGKMFDAVQIRSNGSRAISLALQIADISVGALAQNTRSERVTV
jgi:hypothetical protein